MVHLLSLKEGGLPKGHSQGQALLCQSFSMLHQSMGVRERGHLHSEFKPWQGSSQD